MNFIRFYQILSNFFEANRKKIARLREQNGGGLLQDGENVLTGEHQFYLLES